MNQPETSLSPTARKTIEAVQDRWVAPNSIGPTLGNVFASVGAFDTVVINCNAAAEIFCLSPMTADFPEQLPCQSEVASWYRIADREFAVSTSNRRAAFAPLRCTHIVWPSLEIAILFGSLPMKVDGPTAPVSGLIFVMLLPLAPHCLVRLHKEPASLRYRPDCLPASLLA